MLPVLQEHRERAVLLGQLASPEQVALRGQLAYKELPDLPASVAQVAHRERQEHRVLQELLEAQVSQEQAVLQVQRAFKVHPVLREFQELREQAEQLVRRAHLVLRDQLA